MKEIGKAILAIIVFFVSTIILMFIETFLFAIPILGRIVYMIMYFPMDTQWVLLFTNNIIPIICAFATLEFLKGKRTSSVIVSIALSTVFCLALVGSIIGHNGWEYISTMVTGIIFALYFGFHIDRQ